MRQLPYGLAFNCRRVRSLMHGGKNILCDATYIEKISTRTILRTYSERYRANERLSWNIAPVSVGREENVRADGSLNETETNLRQRLFDPVLVSRLFVCFFLTSVSSYRLLTISRHHPNEQTLSESSPSFFNRHCIRIVAWKVTSSFLRTILRTFNFLFNRELNRELGPESTAKR